MTSQDPLFELIYTLKKEEKRHFRLFARKYDKSSNYLLLFDAIEDMKAYNATELREKFSGMQFTQRLSVAKDYLHSLILRSLRDLEPQTIEDKVGKLIQDIRILLDRRLYAQAKKKITKAEKLAAEYDLIGERFTICDLKGYLPDAERAQLFNEIKQNIKTANDLFEAGSFAEELRVFRELKGLIRTDEDKKELDTILSKYSFPEPETLLPGAKLRYHFGWARYYDTVEDLEKAQEHEIAIAETYLANPSHIESEQLGYILALLNICSKALKLNQRESINKYLDLLRSVKVQKQIAPYHDMLLFRFEILDAIYLKDWERINQLHSDFPHLLEQNKNELNAFGKDMRIEYYLYFAKAFFLQKKFDQALQEIMTLMQLPTLITSPYQENNVRILLLIIHFELGNRSYLPYLIRSTYRFFLRRDRLFQFESIILHYLRSLAFVKTKKDTQISFEKLLDQLCTLSSQPIDREFPWREFYIDWLKTKPNK